MHIRYAPVRNGNYLMVGAKAMWRMEVLGNSSKRGQSPLELPMDVAKYVFELHAKQSAMGHTVL